MKKGLNIEYRAESNTIFANFTIRPIVSIMRVILGQHARVVVYFG